MSAKPIIEREWERNYGRYDRSGTFWTEEEYQALVEAARNGESLKSIASTLRRGFGAITSRARKVLPAEMTREASNWWEELCIFLEDEPDHDWRAALRDQDEPVLSYADLREIAALDTEDPENVVRTSELSGTSLPRAQNLLATHGANPDRSGLKVLNLLSTTDHLPTRAHATDAGMDLRYAGSEPVTLTPEQQALLPTGIAVAVPEGYTGMICPRSGLSAKHGITIVNAPGIIDHGYTGEIKVCLGIIGTTNTHTIEPGERIAQLVLTPIITPPVRMVDTLDDSERGDGGFGSTGAH